jgi:UDP-N-acetylglucosamine--N-acetylmuramyl-(pentapeptide) pyrophosphoryl-undecaprenol N-acetylglucosamine transferase
MLAEQNADAGLANRVAARWASRKFVSFPETRGLEDGEWVGNPVRSDLADFDRRALQAEAASRYSLDPDLPTLGVFGGSLGAGVINEALRSLVADWTGPLQVVHLVGASHIDALKGLDPADSVVWRRTGFEDRMDLFYAACDLVVARSGGGVAELTATGTPAILVPGEFGSSGHQHANARFVVDAGAARLVSQDQIGDLAAEVRETLLDPSALKAMRFAAKRIAKPGAATTIASAMLEAAA